MNDDGMRPSDGDRIVDERALDEFDPLHRLPWPFHLSHHDLSPRRVAVTLTLLAMGFAMILCMAAYSLLRVGPDNPREMFAFYGLPLLLPAIITPILARTSWRFTNVLRRSHESLRGEVRRREAAEARLQQLATTDDLTQLPNRRAFFERAGALAAARAGAHAVVIVDIDHFKQLNDTRGHAAGDRALQQFAAMLMSRARPGTTVARLGGEEFGIIVPGCDTRSGAAMCERLGAGASSLETVLTASFGVTVWCVGRESFDAALGRADAALYRAKEAGRNRTEVIEPTLTAAR